MADYLPPTLQMRNGGLFLFSMLALAPRAFALAREGNGGLPAANVANPQRGFVPLFKKRGTEKSSDRFAWSLEKRKVSSLRLA